MGTSSSILMTLPSLDDDEDCSRWILGAFSSFSNNMGPSVGFQMDKNSLFSFKAWMERIVRWFDNCQCRRILCGGERERWKGRGEKERGLN